MLLLVSLLLLQLPAVPTAGHAPPDTLRLDHLQAAALRQDPRAVQPELLADASLLRIENLRARRRPQLTLAGQATYQSAVATLPVDLPNLDVPTVPRERFLAQAEAEQLLYDGGRLARQADLERAALAEHAAGVAATRYGLREAVTEAYFGALLFQAQARGLALTEQDLEARLGTLRVRVREGAALGAEAAALEAELIRVRQERREAEASRSAALGVLARLTGLPLTADDVLALPDLDAAVADAPLPETALARPELEQFDRMRERLAAEAALAEAQARPHVSLFGQTGVGRPSPFEPFGDQVEPFALVGLRLRWQPLDWGRARREAALRRLQAAITATDADAFTERLLRDVQDDLAQMQRLDAALADDARAVELREEVVRVARRQLEEGVLLAADYADRLTDLETARLTRDRHRIERARAHARYLLTLGHYPGTPTLSE